MMVAGIGCKSGVTAEAVVEALRATLAKHGVEREAVAKLAAPAIKSGEKALHDAATKLALPLVFVDANALAKAAPHTLSHSERSLAATGAPSASEASALAAAGLGARLLGPREIVGAVTCALAVSEVLA